MTGPLQPRGPLAVITCAVIEEELRHFARGLSQVVRFEVLPQGLHNEPARLRQVLQETIERVEAECAPAHIALGFGLCSRGIEGVRARGATLIAVRAHDCITLLLGSKERYAEYVAQHPGTYWYSPGWNRHHVPPGPERHARLLAEYREKYGEDNAGYLMEMEQHWMTAYDRAAYVDVGVGGDREADVRFTRDCARWLGWDFDRQHGDPALLRDLLSGPWDEDRFLVVPPGASLQPTFDDRIFTVTGPSETPP